MIIDPAALVGQVLDGRYRLANFLGRGAVGWVYAAEELVGDTVIGTCALKLLRPGSADQRTSILREFTAAARLSHPKLVRFRGAFEVAGGLLEGCLCLAMELGEGTLRGRLAGGRVLTPEEVSPLLHDLAEALVYLHGQEAVHRDVKPENLLRVGSHWKLGDFGLVRAVQGNLVTASGALGTPGYAAPESYQGKTGPGVDAWALGVVAYEALTGRCPFRGATPEALMAAVLREEPDLAGLPPPFDAVVRGCLVKDLSQRWTAVQVLEALAGEGGEESPVVIPQRSPKATLAAPAPATQPTRAPGSDVPPPTSGAGLGRAQSCVEGLSCLLAVWLVTTGASWLAFCYYDGAAAANKFAWAFGLYGPAVIVFRSTKVGQRLPFIVQASCAAWALALLFCVGALVCALVLPPLF